MSTLPCPYCDKPRWGDCRKAHHCGSTECRIAHKLALRKKLRKIKREKDGPNGGQ